MIAFYRRALTDEGYTVKENVKLAGNPNKYGIVDKDDLLGGTQAAVNDRPIDGLEP